jgi:ABC-type uncharacterized transport system permease subunit
MADVALLLFWPALIGYAEAAVAYAGETVRPGRLAGYAIWGVRLGWLAQTALLIAQAAEVGGFPWDSWAGSLNLFVWMCVGAYLIWGCRAPYRLLGLAVMPLAAALFALAWAAGGVDKPTRSEFDVAFLVAHVTLVLAAFAGFTLAAALSAVYVWQSRRLKRHSPELLRVRAPSLATLDTLISRTIAVALPALTLGIGVGLARLEAEGGRFDVIMGVTLFTWAVYAVFLVLRYEAGWHGRRTALLALAAFALVIAVRLASMPLEHF